MLPADLIVFGGNSLR